MEYKFNRLRLPYTEIWNDRKEVFIDKEIDSTVLINSAGKALTKNDLKKAIKLLASNF